MRTTADVPLPPKDALKLLKEGNGRFVKGEMLGAKTSNEVRCEDERLRYIYIHLYSQLRMIYDDYMYRHIYIYIIIYIYVYCYILYLHYITIL